MRDTIKFHLNENSIANLKELAKKDGLSDEEFDKWVTDHVILVQPL